MSTGLVDITVMRHAETEKAIMISDDGDRKNAKWVPKQHLEIDEGQAGHVIVTMPEWLALDKGFI